jgi:hypothetical protein
MCHVDKEFIENSNDYAVEKRAREKMNERSRTMNEVLTEEDQYKGSIKKA